MSASPFVQKYCAKKLRGVVRPLLGWLLVVGVTAYFGAGLVEDLSDTHTEVTVTAAEETTTSQVTGSRRSKHVEQVRALWVEYSYEGQEQRAKLIADEHGVGDTFTAYVNDRTGSVGLTRPEIGFWNWAIAVVPLLIALLWGWFMFRGIGRTIRLRRFDPESATERFTFVVREFGSRTLGKVTYLRAVGVVASGNAAHASLAAGQAVALESLPGTMPDARYMPAQLEARVVDESALSTTVLVRATGTTEWWAATTAAAEQPAPAPAT